MSSIKCQVSMSQVSSISICSVCQQLLILWIHVSKDAHYENKFCNLLIYKKFQMTFQMTPRMRFGCLGALLLLIAVIIAVSLWSREVHSVVTKIEEKIPDREAKLVDKGQEISELKDSSVAGDVSQDRPCNTKGCMPGILTA